MEENRKQLVNPMHAVRSRLDAIASDGIHDVCDERYKEQSQKNLEKSNKSFMWGEGSKILNSLMMAVIIGGFAAMKVGGLGAVALGLGLAAATLATSYIAFKSRGTNFVNVNEANASLAAREHTKELVPELSKAVGAEVKQAFKDAVKEINHEAIVHGAECVNGSVVAGTGQKETPLALPSAEMRAARNDNIPEMQVESSHARLDGTVQSPAVQVQSTVSK